MALSIALGIILAIGIIAGLAATLWILGFIAFNFKDWVESSGYNFQGFLVFIGIIFALIAFGLFSTFIDDSDNKNQEQIKQAQISEPIIRNLNAPSEKETDCGVKTVDFAIAHGSDGVPTWEQIERSQFYKNCMNQ